MLIPTRNWKGSAYHGLVFLLCQTITFVMWELDLRAFSAVCTPVFKGAAISRFKCAEWVSAFLFSLSYSLPISSVAPFLPQHSWFFSLWYRSLSIFPSKCYMRHLSSLFVPTNEHSFLVIHVINSLSALEDGSVGNWRMVLSLGDWNFLRVLVRHPLG